MMKKVLAAAVLLSCSVAAQASEGGYFGAVAGVMNTSLDGDNPFNAGARAGYNWASGFGVEAEFTTSLVEGEVDFSNAWVDIKEDYSISTVAAYATYRTQGSIYFKGRLGYLNESVDFGDGVDGSDSGLSVGLGAGFVFTEAMTLEAEYTLIEEDVDMWSGTLQFRF